MFRNGQTMRVENVCFFVRQLSKQNKERTNLDKLIATEIKHIDNQIRADCLWHCFGRAPTVPAFVNADKILQQLSAVEVSWPITRNDASNAESAQVIVQVEGLSHSISF